MSLYTVFVGSRSYRIQVNAQQLEVNGEPVKADLVPINAAGSYLMELGGSKRAVQIRSLGRRVYAITSRGRQIQARVEAGTGMTALAAEVPSVGQINAPMPGRVVKVEVKEGNEVQVGQVLVVMESMKMQMELRSPVEGKVERVLVKANDQVEKNALLVQVKEG